MFREVVNFIKSIYPYQNPVPLHAPIFLGREKEYLLDCIDTTFVSYIGKYVTQFEQMTAEYTGTKHAIAIVNGTAALQTALQIAGVKYGNEVITQPLTFVATANAIAHCGAKPVFIDVDLDTMGMSPSKLDDWLSKNTTYEQSSKLTINKSTGQQIAAIVPMHTFGHPCRIDEIVEVAEKFNIPVIEDAAESLGSYYKSKHTGTLGLAGILSYNGNKMMTTGGGGMIVTNNEEFAKKAKYLTTTAKVPHQWEFIHDEVGYNYRLTNVNAAIGVAQMEYLEKLLKNKRETARLYNEFFGSKEYSFFNEPKYSRSNYWLNSIMLKNRDERNTFLEFTNRNGVITRPVWRLLNKLNMYENCQCGNIDNATMLEAKVVNLPSGFRT